MFTEEDTAYAIALAEEERDACPKCGGPKVWCRDPANQFGVFQVHEEQCHATYALATHRNAVNEARDEATRDSVQMWAGFVKGKEPDIYAGLGLSDEDQGQGAGNDG